MCFNYQVSLITFMLGVICSYALICKNTDTDTDTNTYKKENYIFGIFFIFIALIQLMDFIIWIDLDNNYYLNKLIGVIGPILNVCQPVILYIIKYLYFKPKISNLNLDLLVFILNSLYFTYFLSNYLNYLKSSDLITHVSHGNLRWSWLDYIKTNKSYLSYSYLILVTINIMYLTDMNYSFTLVSITYFFLYLSHKYFGYNVGELWCFFGAFIPGILYFIF